MAQVTKHTGGVSLASLEPPAGDRLPLQTAEAISAGDACYIKSDGLIAKAIGSADDEKAIVRGFAMRTVLGAGQDLTLLMDGQRLAYANGTLTPGANLYLSSTVAGGLQTTPAFAGDLPIAWCVDTSRIQIVRGRTDTVTNMRAT